MDVDSLKEFIAKNESEYISLQKILTSHKALAPENGGDGELEKCLALEKFLREHGFENLARFDSPDERVSAKIRPNLVATIPGKNDDFAIWVIAHLDVVPAGDLSAWKTDPWQATEKDGKIFGRGVEDNQQGLVSAFAAAWAFVKNGIAPEHTVKLLFAADEEVGSKHGIFFLLKKHKKIFGKNDLFIIPDGGDKKGETLEIAEKNVLWLKFEIFGKQTHGSRPDQGKNACLASAKFTSDLYDALHKKFKKQNPLFCPPRSTFEPTMRKANVDGVNIIPGKEEFYFDCRIIPEYGCDEVLQSVKEVAQKAQNEFGVKIKISILQKAQSRPTSANSKVVQKMSAALKKAHGIRSRTIGIGGGTVGAELRNNGFDCVVWSTLCDTAHMPNEFCVVKNLVRDAQTLAVLFGA
ncbi:MAG: M20 family metallo-hydrolase [Treponemataceae bacterium]|nr:M20 family metallo-hydrolase [Treponemataceae bacterium]